MAITRSRVLPESFQTGALLACTVGHAIGDAFANFVPPLMYTVRQLFGLSDHHLGLITLLFSVTTNFGQPVFGYVVDRWQPKHTIPVALLLAAVFMCSLGFAPNVYVFVVCLMIAGWGIALFHPRGGALAAEASGSRRALGMSIFGAGGAIGYALASLVAPALHTWGLNLGMEPLQGLIFALPAGVVAVLLLARFTPHAPRPSSAERFRLRRDLLPYMPQLLPLFAVMVLRSGTVTAFATFYQVLQGERGASAMSQGGVLFAFVAGGAVGGIVGGHLSDIWGRRCVTVVSLLLSPAFLWYALTASYWGAVVMLFVGGFTLRGAESVNIAQTQDLLPRGMSTASAISMGFVWGVAGVVPWLVGLVSDHTGSLTLALSLPLLLPVAAAVVALRLPTRPAPIPA
ncbi:MAG: MFS transporter [Armatimonadetes bacterium]|nr:MFS transporter [Armatimonadota bacterium]